MGLSHGPVAWACRMGLSHGPRPMARPFPSLLLSGRKRDREPRLWRHLARPPSRLFGAGARRFGGSTLRRVAQLVEQRPYKPRVAGSSPVPPTSPPHGGDPVRHSIAPGRRLVAGGGPVIDLAERSRAVRGAHQVLSCIPVDHTAPWGSRYPMDLPGRKPPTRPVGVAKPGGSGR
jgi:hypothetical protein